TQGAESDHHARVPLSSIGGATSLVPATTSDVTIASAGCAAGASIALGRCATAYQASTSAEPTIAAASQKVAPTQKSWRPDEVSIANNRVNSVGAMMPAIAERLATAPCSRPCSRGSTWCVMIACAAGPATPQSAATGIIAQNT